MGRERMKPYLRADSMSAMRNMANYWSELDRRGTHAANLMMQNELEALRLRVGARNILAMIDQYLHVEKNCSGS